MKYTYRPMEAKTRQSGMRCDKEDLFGQELDKAIRDDRYGSSSKKGKRFRSAFTTEQINYLEAEFKKYPYVGISRRKDVASILNIPERAVKIWFQNRRMKEKKDLTSKEQDVDTDGIKKVKTVPLVHDGDLISLSLMQTAEVSNNINNLTNNLAANYEKSLPPTPHLVKTSKNYYDDITPEPDLVTISKVNTLSTVIKTNPSPVSKSSAEFSIELLKKYKTEKSECATDTTYCQLRRSEAREATPKIENQESFSPSRFSPYSPIAVPQDLSSSKKENTLYTQPASSFQPTGPVMNSTNLPVYLKGFYSQPYMPPGNMIWKPVNMAPIMSTGLPMPMTIANNPVASGQIPQPIISKRNCNCDCHLKPYTPILLQQNNPAPPMQYVITAVPFQNHLSKF